MTSSKFPIYIIGVQNGALTYRLYSKLQELELPVHIFPAAAESIEHAAARGVKKIVIATEPTIEQDMTARIILAARSRNIALLPVGTREDWEAIIPISMPELFDTQVWAPEDAWEKEIPVPETPKVKMVYGVRVTQRIPDISSMIPIVDLAGLDMNDNSDPTTEICRADKRQNILSTVTKATSGGRGSLIMIFSLTLALLLAGAAAFYYFSNICRISEEEKQKANYKDSTYRAMSECLCDDCKQHLTRISNDFHKCRIEENKKKDAKKDDAVYQAMQQCVKDRNCKSCEEHLARIDEEFKKCMISDEQKQAAQKDDATYKAMQQCVKDRDCESCKEYLARIDEKCNISDDQKNAAKRDDATYKAMQQCVKDRNCESCIEHLKRIDETVEKACSLSDAQKNQRNTAKKGDATYKAMKKCLKNTKNKCLLCEIAIRISDSRATCPNSVISASPAEINREDSLHHMKTFLCEDCRAALANLCTVTDETQQKALEGDAAAKDAVQKCVDIRNCHACTETLQQAEGSAAEQTCVNQSQEAPTEEALKKCMKENQCSHCREKLAAQNPALIQCNIDPEKAKTAAKDDDTYKAMQTCVKEKQCPACKEHLKRIDDEKRQEQNRACTVGDGGNAESWWNCVVERNCEQCWNKLKENSKQNQKEQADKPQS